MGPGMGPGMQGPGAFRGPTADVIFERLDKNHDGKLTKDEIPDAAWQRFSGAADKDGAITRPALEDFLKKNPPMPFLRPRGGPGQNQPPGENRRPDGPRAEAPASATAQVDTFDFRE